LVTSMLTFFLGQKILRLKNLEKDQ